MPGSSAISRIIPPIRTPPAICMPHVALMSFTDSLIPDRGPFPRSMIIGNTKKEMTDQATAAREARIARRMVMMMLSPPLPWIMDNNQPTAVWIAAHPSKAGNRPNAAAIPAPKDDDRPFNSSLAQYTSPPIHTWVISVPA